MFLSIQSAECKHQERFLAYVDNIGENGDLRKSLSGLSIAVLASDRI